MTERNINRGIFQNELIEKNFNNGNVTKQITERHFSNSKRKENLSIGIDMRSEILYAAFYKNGTAYTINLNEDEERGAGMPVAIYYRKEDIKALKLEEK